MISLKFGSTDKFCFTFTLPLNSRNSTSMKLFVAGLPYDMDDAEASEWAFSIEGDEKGVLEFWEPEFNPHK